MSTISDFHYFVYLHTYMLYTSTVKENDEVVGLYGPLSLQTPLQFSLAVTSNVLAVKSSIFVSPWLFKFQTMMFIFFSDDAFSGKNSDLKVMLSHTIRNRIYTVL